jgi:ABC-type transport system involved in multi-copper enzyme maturation permease subunit
MLHLIIEKELRDIIGNMKFAVSFAVCSLLILLAFYSGAATYHTQAARYEAAKRENLKQLEGLTDWIAVRHNRIFLPPDPLACLVSGVSNDIGRTTEVPGRGELLQDDSRYNEEPVFAVFRFLDLEFIFQIVLSLFAILFAYDAVNGEKERGTLRLTFANPVPRQTYVTGKLVGAFLALAVPLLIPILLGSLLLVLAGVPMSTDNWTRLALIIGAGFLYFSAFLTIAVAVSAMTVRSANSFLMLLVIWIFAVLIVPRTAVLIAGRAVDVPSVDEIGAKKARLNQQLWTEDREKMSAFKPSTTGDPQKMIAEFQKFMGSIADEREKRMDELSSRLNEERQNAQAVQQTLAFGIARLSPCASFSLAASKLAGTSLDLQERYRDEAKAYQQTYGKFLLDKTGLNPGGGMVFRMRTENGEQPKPIDPQELPPFLYRPFSLSDVLPGALLDMGLLSLFCLLFFAAAHVAFTRYDLR